MKIPSVPQPQRFLEQAAKKSPPEAVVMIDSRLQEVVRGFPNFDTLDAFTNAMMVAQLDKDKLKQSLGRIHGIQKSIKKLGKLPKREFLGRLKSILKKLEKPLKLLHDARIVLRRIPDATISFTVCLAGFPNAGKSTLLKKLTGAKVEIANYEFTTLSLNYGTTEIRFHPVQIIDTPGTLNREKTNPIEKQAQLALKHLAKAIVFVFDPMRDSESQEQLFKTLDKYEVPIALYASKQDLVKQLPEFGSDVQLFTKPEEVVAWIEPLLLAAEKPVDGAQKE